MKRVSTLELDRLLIRDAEKRADQAEANTLRTRAQIEVLEYLIAKKERGAREQRLAKAGVPVGWKETWRR
jgi:hypothetical protein